MIQLRSGDTYIEIDENFSNQEIDTLAKLEDDLEDTIELSLDFMDGDSDGK